jgi:hypothetical protein
VRRYGPPSALTPRVCWTGRGVGRCERSFPVLPSCRFSKLHCNKKTRAPCTDKGSHIVGAHLTRDYNDQKKSAPCDTRCDGKTSRRLNHHEVQRSSNANVQPFSAASGSNRATVRECGRHIGRRPLVRSAPIERDIGISFLYFGGSDLAVALQIIATRLHDRDPEARRRCSRLAGA